MTDGQVITLRNAGILAGYIRETWNQPRVTEYLNQQRWNIQQWTDEHDMTILDFYEEVDKGGDLPWEQRPVLTRALLAIRQGYATGLITDSTDRVSRGTLIAEGVRHQVWSAGARVYTATDGEILRDQGSAEQLQARLMYDRMDADELILTRRRRQRGAAYAKAQQRYRGGDLLYGRPYGRNWTVLPNGRRDFIAHPEEQAIIAELIRLHEEEGYGWKRLCKWLTENEHPTVSGAKWHPNTVREIVRRGLMPENLRNQRALHPQPAVPQATPKLHIVGRLA